MNNELISNCPKCNSANICEISYGYPGDEEEFLQLVAEKKIFPGGCCIEPDSPTWHCNQCEFQWSIYNDDVDSFDYDQGFNLNEVYDQ